MSRLCAFAFRILAITSCASRGLDPRPPAYLLKASSHSDSEGVDSGYVPLIGGALYYEARGTGTPVVFIHGGNLDRRLWDDQVRVFARRFKVIRYDVRNFGRSTIAQASYESHDDLYRLVRFLKVTRVHIVGLSLGGRIAVDFALLHPTMVDRLVLAGPGLSGFRFSNSNPSTNAALTRAIERGDSDAVAELWLRSPYMKPAMEHADLQPTLRLLARENARAWFGGEQFEVPLDPPAISRLSELRAPTLLVLGERDVPDIHRIVQLLAEKIIDNRRVEFRGVGHLVNLESPAEFNRLVADFLGKND